MQAPSFLLLLLLAAPRPEVPWLDWSARVFQRAAEGRRLVLLHLGAGWCHWCHVMEETTYRDPEVVALLAKGYVAVHVDQDTRPDLAAKYGDYGWPATILFDAKGTELAKMRGYLPPPRMAAMLRAFLDDPTPGPSAAPEPAVAAGPDAGLPEALRRELDDRFVAAYDREHGGWGTVHKYLDADSVEYAMRGDAAMARETLDRARSLLDPAWGGLYQYSHGGVWENPHFEKIMATQAAGLRMYAAGHARWGDPSYLDAARGIARYLREFLRSPDGAFYASQDADLVKGEHAEEYFRLDDAERRRLGVPAVDRHLFARENGWAARSLAGAYGATGDGEALADARRAVAWVLEHRALEGGGFRHDEVGEGGPFLADTLAMGEAFLALYRVTAERPWLDRASAALRFLDGRLRGPAAGYLTAAPPAVAFGPFRPEPNLEENVAMARFAAMLARCTGDAAHRTAAERAMRFVAGASATRRGIPSGILLADDDLRREPVHVTVSGRKDDARAAALFRAALRLPVTHLLVEWQDEREGPLPNPASAAPPSEPPAAFVCADGACSPPVRDPKELSRAAGLAAPEAPPR